MSDALSPRARAFLDAFLAIDARMRDLPLYNPKIEVALFGFAPEPTEPAEGSDGEFGILVTPWAINAVHLPDEPIAYDENRLGRRAPLTLAGREIPFIWGGEETVGLFRQFSLHSPCPQFVLQAQALAEARLKRAELTTPPAVETPAADDAAPVAEAPAPARPKPTGEQLARRELLFGRARHA